MSNIPIFLSSDNNYAPFVATTIASICDNTKSFCEFYILDGGIEPENRKKICELKNKFDNFSIEFIKIDTEKYFGNLKEVNYISKSMYNRFLIPDLKPNIDKALYSDVDVIVLGDIQHMYDEVLDKYALGAVWEEYSGDDSGRKSRLGISEKHKFFSSGNLLINCKLWRENHICQELLSLAERMADKLEFPDMDILNKYFDNNYKILAPKYCWINQNCKYYKNADFIIRHFNGPVKPWHISPSRDVEDLLPNHAEFWKYMQMTDFYEDFTGFEDDSNIRKLKIYSILIKNKMAKRS